MPGKRFRRCELIRIQPLVKPFVAPKGWEPTCNRNARSRQSKNPSKQQSCDLPLVHPAIVPASEETVTWAGPLVSKDRSPNFAIIATMTVVPRLYSLG